MNRWNATRFKVASIVAAVVLCFVPTGGEIAMAGTVPPPEYRSLTLGECLSLASRHNPALGGATERIRELTQDYRAVRSGFFPRLSFLAYYERLDPDRLPPGGSTASPSGEFNQEEAFAGISGKQILFNGGVTRYGTQAASIGTHVQKQDVRRTRDEVVFEVTQAFYRLLEAKENRTVAENALKQRQDFAGLTEAFFRAGKVTKLDFFRASSQASDARQAKVEAENAVRLAREILARTIGLKEQIEVDIRGRLSPQYSPAPDIGVLWKEALDNNPEIKRLNLEIEQSKALVGVEKGRYFPELSLRGDVGVRHQDTRGTQGEWLAGVFVEFPFFEGGLTRAHVAAADSRYLQLLEKKRDRLNGLRVDLTSACQDWNNATNGIVDIRRTVEANQEAYASAQALYRNGKAIGLDVLRAEVDLTASRFNLVRYAAAFEIAKARVRQIVGAPIVEQSGPADNGGQTR